MQGGLTAGPQGNELVLNLVGKDVPLGEDLRDALSPHIQQVWDSLAAARRGRSDGRGPLPGGAEEVQRRRVGRAAARDHVDRAVHFPYRLDQLQGVLTYQRRAASSSKASGPRTDNRHDRRQERFRGFLARRALASHFDGLWIEHLVADRELDRGPAGAAEEGGGRAESDRLDQSSAAVSTWSGAAGRASRCNRVGTCDLDSTQAGIRCGGLLLENLHGEVLLWGGFDGQRTPAPAASWPSTRSAYKDCQFTQVIGPIWIDDGRVLFGSWVDRPEGKTRPTEATGPRQPPRPLTARASAAEDSIGDGWVMLGPEPRYAVNATLTDADLARCARNSRPGGKQLRGKILATADLTGSGRTRNALSGRGSDSPLRRQRLRTAGDDLLAENSQHSTARPERLQRRPTIDYRIEGEHIYFDRIDFRRRRDQPSRQGRDGLPVADPSDVLRPRWAAANWTCPLIKQVFRGAGQQLMLIHVDGTLQNPETRSEALPG